MTEEYTEASHKQRSTDKARSQFPQYGRVRKGTGEAEKRGELGTPWFKDPWDKTTKKRWVPHAFVSHCFFLKILFKWSVVLCPRG